VCKIVALRKYRQLMKGIQDRDRWQVVNVVTKFQIHKRQGISLNVVLITFSRRTLAHAVTYLFKTYYLSTNICANERKMAIITWKEL
jgi:hypothetical protein